MKKPVKIVLWGLGGFVGLMVVIGIIASVSGGDDDDANAQEPAASQSPATSKNPTPTPEPTATPEPIEHEYSGTGSSVVGPFETSEGVLVVATTHSGRSNFVVRVVDSEGEIELAINEIGTYSGAIAIPVVGGGFLGLQPGPTRIQIDADGSWTLRTRQTFPSAGQPPPLNHEGRGSDVVSWLLLREDQYIMNVSNSGRSNYVVRLVSSNGETRELVVNEIGDYSGQHLLNVRGGAFIGLTPGLYALAVESDGHWQVTIE